MINTGTWQDYRGKGEGILIHLDTTSNHALPVREPVDEKGNPMLEPNYENGTHGFLQCLDAKTRLAAMKNRRRYFLFGTRYQGSQTALRGKFLIVGYMRLDKVMEARKRHIRKWMEQGKTGAPAPECMDMEECPAFRSEEMNFYAPEDAFELSEASMKKWGYKGKITKQMKLTFTEDKLGQILTHFKGKPSRNGEYVTVSRELETAVEAARENAGAGEAEW